METQNQRKRQCYLKMFKHFLIATLITAAIIFAFIRSVESNISIDSFEPGEIVLAHELLDRDMAIMVLGGIDYYVESCTALTERGVEYRNQIISFHSIEEGFLPINPTYIQGILAVSGYDCYEMYELIIELDTNNLGLIEEPVVPVDKEEKIS